jgi:rod shape-determining protein MreD
MIRTILVFFVACIVGLVVQATFAHTISPFAIAPDVIVILAVYLGLNYQHPLGVIGAFLLGVAGDFASAQFVGPVAAGSVLVYGLTVMVSQKVYAENPFAIVMLTFLCSIADSLIYLLMVVMYVNVDLFGEGVVQGVLVEAGITAAIAPFIMTGLKWGTRKANSVQASAGMEGYRYSLRSR